MKSFLLLVILLMEGSEAPSKMKGCLNGWIEFICGYNNTSITKYHMIDVVTPKETLQSTQRDEWENKGRWFLYHDTTNQHLRVIFKQLQREDFGKQQCKFHTDSVSAPEITELELDMDDDNCQHTTFNHTTYTTAQTTILCTDKGNRVRFFCKDNGFICEDILSTTVKSNGSFSLTDNNSGFNMSISDVSSQDAGVYWCGVKPNQGNYRAALQRIQLEVQNISVIKRSSAVGQTLTYWCSYPEDAPVNKFICKGEDPYVCEQLVNISTNMKTGKLSIEDDREERNITVTVRNLTAEDTGTYWCGAGTSDEKRRNQLFNKLVLTVAGSQLAAVTATVVRVAALVVVNILILFYTCSKIRRNRREKQKSWDRGYAEVQDPPRRPSQELQ
ncbi:polymeric immunoglobulin receptor-like isoform X2 [Channa argus]|uniref:polymeric immunoglobulin receptor-like isoform X1 n=1 Tax=Channa argus TaxID=215402 RepID=UPI00351FA61B